MTISGWAGNLNQEELSFQNQKMYFMFVLFGKHDFVEVTDSKSGYAHTEYKGRLLPGHPDITAMELAVYLDKGNLCFGGISIIQSDNFTCKVYTD